MPTVRNSLSGKLFRNDSNSSTYIHIAFSPACPHAGDNGGATEEVEGGEYGSPLVPTGLNVDHYQ